MRFTSIPKEYEKGLSLLADFLALPDVEVAFEKAEGLTLSEKDGKVVIGCGSERDALRALSMVPRFLKEKKPIRQSAKFDTLCLMADCSRNAVPKVESLKTLLLHLASMGFNALMLYTEDTYEITEYPYFGHLRGRYTKKELKEIDAYAAALGIEVIPCIQTLAHLNAIFEWPAFGGYGDIDDILLTDDEKVDALIEAMIKTARECFRTRRIHIGMDEAHHLGRGRHQDIHGAEKKSDIMLRHLAKVIKICKKYDFEPVMWSDMFFRMQFNGKYYVEGGELSKEVTEKIPPEVALCYWDYYTTPEKEKLLDHMFRCHAGTGREVWFAGGAWCWSGATPRNALSTYVTPKQLEYAEKYGIKNVVATAWGDDGAECSVFAVLPTLLLYAEICYGGDLEERCPDCFGISYEDFMKIDAVDYFGKSESPFIQKAALFNDPLIGRLDNSFPVSDLDKKYAADILTLSSAPEFRYSLLFETQKKLAAFLSSKVYLSRDIKAAYRSGDKAALKKLASERIPEVLSLLDGYHSAFRKQWYTLNKAFGFEIQDIRLGGLRERLVAAGLRVTAYLNGDVDRLEELEEKDLSFNPGGPGAPTGWWAGASACVK